MIHLSSKMKIKKNASKYRKKKKAFKEFILKISCLVMQSNYNYNKNINYIGFNYIPNNLKTIASFKKLKNKN